MSDKYAALKQAAENNINILENIAGYDPEDIDGDTVELRFEHENGYESGCDVSIVDQCQSAADVIKLLLAERDADRARIAELAESHSKLRDTMATIHNTIRMDGGYTPLAVILNASKRAHEESAAAAAGLSLKIEGE